MNTKYWQRNWTMAELAREHPLPDGWGWIADSGDCWSAVCRGGAVGVDEFGHVFFTSDGMPSEVVLAVIQASRRPMHSASHGLVHDRASQRVAADLGCVTPGQVSLIVKMYEQEITEAS